MNASEISALMVYFGFPTILMIVAFIATALHKHQAPPLQEPTGTAEANDMALANQIMTEDARLLAKLADR